MVHIMAQVGQKYNSRLVYDPTDPDIDRSFYKKYYWTEVCLNPKEVITINALEPIRKEVLWTVIMQEIRNLTDQEIVS